MMKTIDALDQLHAEQGTEEGFTLIELLIVMSVMLILMTLAVPQLLKIRKQGQELSAVQSIRTIGQAELQYNSAYPSMALRVRWPRWGAIRSRVLRRRSPPSW